MCVLELDAVDSMNELRRPLPQTSDSISPKLGRTVAAEKNKKWSREGVSAHGSGVEVLMKLLLLFLFCRVAVADVFKLF